MRVVLSTHAAFPFHGYGGIEKFPYFLARQLIQQGLDVEIVTSADRNKRRVETHEGIKYTFIPPCYYWKRSSFLGYASMVNLNLYLLRQKFDILHGFSATPYLYLHAPRRAPVLMQPFGMEMFRSPCSLHQRGITKWYWDLFRRHPWRYCITHADAVAAEGDFQIDDMVRIFKIPRAKIGNIAVGVDVPGIEEKLKARKRSRSELGLRDSEIVLLSVNRFIPDKGLAYLVEAFGLIKQGLPDARLLLIGGAAKAAEQAEFDRIQGQINGYGQGVRNSISILKDVPEDSLYDYYGAADVYVSPTLITEFIMSTNEAMVCGLPVISTSPVVVKDGINGAVVPPANAQAIADAVIKLYKEGKAEAAGRMSREIIKQYDWSYIARQAITMYEGLLNRRR